MRKFICLILTFVFVVSAVAISESYPVDPVEDKTEIVLQKDLNVDAIAFEGNLVHMVKPLDEREVYNVDNATLIKEEQGVLKIHQPIYRQDLNQDKSYAYKDPGSQKIYLVERLE